jgi:acyl dehydratase
MAIASERPSPPPSQGDSLDEALEETFPASDPVAVGHSEHAGTPEGHARTPEGHGKTPPGHALAPGGSAVPIAWFDDLALGMRFRSAERRVTAEAIKRFAAEFDPQAYHLDEEAAKATPLKGLAASGWHTAAIVMRLMTDARPFGPHPLLGLGVDDLRWLAPVRPGDALHLEGEVIELLPSATKPQGIAKVRWTAVNQRGEPVYTVTPLAIVPRRPE